MRGILPVTAATLALGAVHQGQRSGRLRLQRSLGGHNATTLRELYPFYHTSGEIHRRLVDLSKRCPGMALESVEGTSVSGDTRSIEVATIRAPGASPVNKNFLLFGEHARELIGPESGLHFVEALCGEHPELKDRARQVLADNEFQIVVNANPGSRPKVEQGDFCLRTNPNGVDLNRNWAEEWESEGSFGAYDETNPGPAPFSEAETRILKELVKDYKPTNFLTVHSGTKGMYMPWAYDTEHLAKRNRPQMMKILKKVDQDHCQCPFGAAGKEVGYPCPGTCLDWVYDQLKTPYSFAFEIYTWDDPDLKARWQEKISAGGSLLQAHSHLAHPHFRDFFENQPSDFVQLRSGHDRHHQSSDGVDDRRHCFSMFNPVDQDVFRDVVDNWTRAYFDTAEMVAVELKNGGAKPTSA